MKIVTPRALVATGLAACMLLVSSCSDAHPGTPDAPATCNCLPAEPPLAGRIEVVKTRGYVSGYVSAAETIHVAECPAGSLILGGGCGGPLDQRGLVLRYSKATDHRRAWLCVFENSGPSAQVEVEAYCLVPGS